MFSTAFYALHVLTHYYFHFTDKKLKCTEIKFKLHISFATDLKYESRMSDCSVYVDLNGTHCLCVLTFKYPQSHLPHKKIDNDNIYLWDTVKIKKNEIINRINFYKPKLEMY